MTPGDSPILTLEPLIAAVQGEIEEEGWGLSGLQKTTSHQFEGRWEGESTRSAYLFFHRPTGPEGASIDVFLDETDRGLTGNLALVLELKPLGEHIGARETLATLASLADAALPTGVRHPLTLRARLGDASDDTEGADMAVRFKVNLPRKTIQAGGAEVRALVARTVGAYADLLENPALLAFLASE